MSNINVEDNLGLVWDVINKYFGGGTNYTMHGVDRDDMFQLGCIGLMKAVDRFDESKGTSFYSYAFTFISGEIRHDMRDRGRMVKFPRNVHEIVARIHVQDRANEMTFDKVVKEFDLSDEYAIMVMDCMGYKAISGDTKVSGDEENQTTLMETLEDESFSLESNVVSSIELQQRLSILTDRERNIIELRLSGRTQPEIAKLVGLSQMQISRILRKVVKKIEEKFDNELLVW